MAWLVGWSYRKKLKVAPSSTPQGTISTTANDKNVTGSGTNFTEWIPGDILVDEYGCKYEIDSIVDDTHLTLKEPYPFSASSLSYGIISTGIQLKFTIHYGSGTDSGFELYLNSHCKTDFSDLKVTCNDGVTSLPFCVTDVSNGNTATLYLKLDVHFDGTIIYLYYGNSDISNYGREEDVFEKYELYDSMSTYSGPVGAASYNYIGQPIADPPNRRFYKFTHIRFNTLQKDADGDIAVAICKGSDSAPDIGSSSTNVADHISSLDSNSGYVGRTDIVKPTTNGGAYDFDVNWYVGNYDKLWYMYDGYTVKGEGGSGDCYVGLKEGSGSDNVVTDGAADYPNTPWYHFTDATFCEGFSALVYKNPHISFNVSVLKGETTVASDINGVLYDKNGDQMTVSCDVFAFDKDTGILLAKTKSDANGNFILKKVAGVGEKLAFLFYYEGIYSGDEDIAGAELQTLES